VLVPGFTWPGQRTIAVVSIALLRLMACSLSNERAAAATIELDQGAARPARVSITRTLVGNLGGVRHDSSVDMDNPLIGWFVRGR
jgi:hypothetical protein